MKAILILTTIFFSVWFFSIYCFAANIGWVPESQIKNPVNIHSGKIACEVTHSPDTCFEVAGQDLRKVMAGFRPINITNTVDCSDSSDCQSKVTANTFTCLNSETTSFDDKANWPGLDFTAESPPRPASGWFLWCQLEQLVTDAAGTTAAIAADAAKASDDSARASAKTQRVTDMGTCVLDSKSATLTLPQATACIRALVRERLGDGVSVGDL